ncbi:ribosomal 60S subunit protein L8A [Martiniozyma asiatica (nom. inval.)]|nr:ribosomal 60S subunit protein L8A [Martiniozyma asiatica]
MAPGKKVAPAPLASKAKKSASSKNPLFVSTPKSFGLGQDVQPKRNLGRFVKWPEYVRLQRQKKILKLRLKVPPSIAQFSATLDKNTAAETFKLLNKYRPETSAEKKERLTKEAAAVAEGKTKEEVSEKPYVVKYGLNHVVGLIENKKAKLVLIANDVDPIELVVFLPALCKKMGVPYAIVKGKARLGTLVHQKNAAVAALVDVKAEDEPALANLISTINANYIDKYDESRKHWGGGVMGAKTQSKLAKRAKAAAIAAAAAAKRA